LLAKRDFHLQTGNLGYKTGLSFTNGESWVTNGILGLLFTDAGIALGIFRHKLTINIKNVLINIKSEIMIYKKGE